MRVSLPSAAPPTPPIRKSSSFWMLGTSSILLIVAVLFLRKSRSSLFSCGWRDAAESFGKGREALELPAPRRARSAARGNRHSWEMKARIERSIEQRTAMLAGVSHDLRTILTRFKLELVLIGDSPGGRRHAQEMSTRCRQCWRPIFRSGPRRLRRGRPAHRHDDGAGGVAAATPSATAMSTTVTFHGLLVVIVEAGLFKRCLGNLVSNAARHAKTISITGHRGVITAIWTVTVDDDAAGHSRQHARGSVQAVPAARRRPQPGRGRHRPRPLRSPATSPVRMAATSPSATARWAVCARRYGCRCSWLNTVARMERSAIRVSSPNDSAALGFRFAFIRAMGTHTSAAPSGSRPSFPRPRLSSSDRR